jgi:hypothetical protein
MDSPSHLLLPVAVLCGTALFLADAMLCAPPPPSLLKSARTPLWVYAFAPAATAALVLKLWH